MSKQSEIRRWFCKYLARFNGQLNYDRLPRHRKDSYKMMVDEDIMPYLHSQGVVIKVDRELPEKPVTLGANLPSREQANVRNHWKLCQETMLKWHNDSLEPLIEEVKEE